MVPVGACGSQAVSQLGPAGLSPHAQRTRAPNWAEKEVSRVLLRLPSWAGQTAIYTQRCPAPSPNRRPCLEPSTTDQSPQHLASPGPKLVGPEAVHRPAWEGNAPPAHRQCCPEPYLEVIQSHDVFMFQFLG